MDRVDLGNGLLIDQQSIGVAKEQKSFGNGIDGILGVGPQGLSCGTPSPLLSSSFSLQLMQPGSLAPPQAPSPRNPTPSRP